MSALNERQRRYVEALLITGARDHTQAAIMAGYSASSDNVAQVAGYRLAHNSKVQAAIREEAERRINAGALLAASKLIEIAANDHHKDQFQASREILNRAGLIVETQHRVIVDHAIDEEKIAKIKRLAGTLGLDPVKLLGTAGYIEGEYEEVMSNTTSTEQSDASEDIKSEEHIQTSDSEFDVVNEKEGT